MKHKKRIIGIGVAVLSLVMMLAYTVKHLDGMGLDIMRHIAGFLGVNQ